MGRDPARRTLRTNLRFIGRRVVPQLYPADLPLPRDRAKAPYAAAEIAGLRVMPKNGYRTPMATGTRTML